MQRIRDDKRIDPRLKALLLNMGEPAAAKDAPSRDHLLETANSLEARLAYAEAIERFEICDSEEVAPSAGLSVKTMSAQSNPDGNQINFQVIRPDNSEVLPCVFYIHGGGMRQSSCFDGNYRAWGRMIAAQNVAVVMIDFRNAIVPSSVGEVAPFPAGLNDCVSGIRWLHSMSGSLNIDSTRIVVAGESGGGNLTLSVGMKLKRDGELSLIKGLYALCPYIAGTWPLDQFPSSHENNGIFFDLHSNEGAVAYGIDAFDEKNPLAWPSFADIDDVRGLVPTIISVNECDPLRDEGIEFYRLLLKAGVAARCRQIMGTIHGTEAFPIVCPEISEDAARDIAAFSRAPK